MVGRDGVRTLRATNAFIHGMEIWRHVVYRVDARFRPLDLYMNYHSDGQWRGSGFFTIGERVMEAVVNGPEGVALARDRFLASLDRHGVEKVDPAGEEFDPNTSEAVRVDPVDEAERDGTVTETLRPGYRLGEHVVRPARVAVGRRK